MNLSSDILNLGSGNKRIEGALNVDVTPDTKPELVHDLNKGPWPLPDNHFREIHAFDVLEHLDNLLLTFEEIHHIARPGAVLKLTVPHFSSANAFMDPTHRRFFALKSFDYFTGDHEHSFYTRVRFKLRSRSLIFENTWANKVVRLLAASRSDTYEHRWAWIFPAWFIYAELEVVKV